MLSPSDCCLFKNLCTRTHSQKSHADAELDAKQWSRFNCQRNVAFKFSQIEPSDYHIWGNDKGLSQVPCNIEDNHQTKGYGAGAA